MSLIGTTYETLLPAVKAALDTHPWTLFNTPARSVPWLPKTYLGPRLSVSDAVDGSGVALPICITAFGRQAQESNNTGNIREHNKAIYIAAGVPWLETNQNEIDRLSLATELARFISANPQLGGLDMAAWGGLEFMRLSLDGPTEQIKSYRAVVMTITGLDYWTIST